MENRLKANKELGQHFLKDKSVISKIILDAPNNYDLIVEVGPGPGALTRPLSELGKPLYLIEKDSRFESELSLENVVKVFIQDAMVFDWEVFVKENRLERKKIWLVSNLPYNVSSQLFVQFLQVPQVSNMTLMYQKEVGEKTYPRQNIKNQSNSLLALSSVYTESKLLTKVSPGAFHPPPKVESVVVSYRRKENPPLRLEEFQGFERFLRSLFSFKRKQLGSALKPMTKGKELALALQKAGFDTKRRAESLSQEEVLKAYKVFKQLV